jgi:quercetin dioxygenase-like cupin family protein
MPRYQQFPPFLDALPEVDIKLPGVTGRLLQAGERQVVFAEFAETVEVPEHQHQEQWEFCLAGRVDLRIGGEIVVHEAGDNFFIPADVPHGAVVHAGYRAMMVFNAADRYSAK